MIYFLENITGIENFSCKSSDFFPIFQSIKFMIRFIQIAVPFALVIWGSIDWFKALIAHDEKEMRMKRKPFVTRVIAALIVLIMPWLTEGIAKIIVGENNSSDYFKCYLEAKPRLDFSKWQKKARSTGNGEILGGSSGGAVNSGTSKSNVSGTTRTKKAVSCKEFTTKSSCENGSSKNYDCQWVNTSGKKGCVEGKKIQRTCSQYGQNNGLSCPKVDDYNTPCEIVKISGTSGIIGCAPKSNPKKCEDYGKNISKASCLSKDDYGKSCKWETTNGSTGNCVTK